MKKFITAIIAILYLASSSGVAMDIHYCMGKQSGVEFYSAEVKICGKCGMSEKKGCCHDKHQFYKLNDAHKIVAAESKINTDLFKIFTSFYQYNCDLYVSKEYKSLQSHSPPFYIKPPAYIMNCVFRL